MSNLCRGVPLNVGNTFHCQEKNAIKNFFKAK